MHASDYLEMGNFYTSEICFTMKHLVILRRGHVSLTSNKNKCNHYNLIQTRRPPPLHTKTIWINPWIYIVTAESYVCGCRLINCNVCDYNFWLIFPMQIIWCNNIGHSSSQHVRCRVKRPWYKQSESSCCWRTLRYHYITSLIPNATQNILHSDGDWTINWQNSECRNGGCECEGWSGRLKILSSNFCFRWWTNIVFTS